MIIYIEFKKDIHDIIGFQTYNEDDIYIESPYLVKVNHLVYNLVTYEMIELQENEYEANKKFLIEHWFYFPKDLDPYTFVLSIKQTFFRLKKEHKVSFINHYTILTTTNCNARCPYCYEKDCDKYNMTAETAHDVANFIIKKSNSFVTFRWFGGEPLVNSEAIDIITTELSKKGIRFSSSIISNGYLFDEKDIDKWNITRVQITLDGTEEQYNKIKNYTNKSVNAFQKVLNNIEMLLEKKIKVSVRLNLSSENIDDMTILIKQLYDRFRNYSNFSIYSHSLFDEEDNEDNFYYIQDYLKKLKINKTIYSLSSNRICNYCMVNSVKSIVINPKGELGLCEHCYESDIVGSIYNDTINYDLINAWQEPLKTSNCKECTWFPHCSKIKKCPVVTCSKGEVDYNINRIKESMIRRKNG